jgi:hypothetical protein
MEADVIKNLLGPIDDFEDSLLTTVCRNAAHSRAGNRTCVCQLLPVAASGIGCAIPYAQRRRRRFLARDRLRNSCSASGPPPSATQPWRGMRLDGNCVAGRGHCSSKQCPQQRSAIGGAVSQWLIGRFLAVAVDAMMFVVTLPRCSSAHGQTSWTASKISASDIDGDSCGSNSLVEWCGGATAKRLQCIGRNPCAVVRTTRTGCHAPSSPAAPRYGIACRNVSHTHDWLCPRFPTNGVGFRDSSTPARLLGCAPVSQPMELASVQWGLEDRQFMTGEASPPAGG